MDILNIISNCIPVLISLLISISLKIIENNIDDKNIPKTIEEFNDSYNENVDKIINEKVKNCSSLLEVIIDNKITSNNEKLSGSEEKSAEYSKFLGKHEDFLIEVYNWNETKNNYKSLRDKYDYLQDIIKIIKNLSYVMILFSVFMGLIIISVIFCCKNILIYIWTESIVLFNCFLFIYLNYWLKYKSITNFIKDYKNKITEDYNNIKKLSDGY